MGLQLGQNITTELTPNPVYYQNGFG